MIDQQDREAIKKNDFLTICQFGRLVEYMRGSHLHFLQLQLTGKLSKKSLKLVSTLKWKIVRERLTVDILGTGT